MQIKAIACELPAKLGLPLSRLSTGDIVREAQRSGIVATFWQQRTWIFPRDPQFIPKAGRILDLYARQWEGRPLRDDEFSVLHYEKTSIQAL